MGWHQKHGLATQQSWDPSVRTRTAGRSYKGPRLGEASAQRREGSPLVMEGMWDEGWRSVCLPLDTQITLRGGNSWPLPKTTSYSRGFDAKCPGYPCWAQLWMESLPSCRKKNLLPGLLQFKGATISSSGASAPAQGSALGRQGFQVDYLIYPAAEGALALVHKHINISGCCQE